MNMTRETTKRAITTVSIVVVILLIAVYAYIASHSLLSGPVIDITTINGASTTAPIKGTIYASVSTSTVIISGTAQRIQSINLNGAPIVIDESGNFSEIVALFPGFNAETFTAKDAFGHSARVELDLNRE